MKALKNEKPKQIRGRMTKSGDKDTHDIEEELRLWRMS
jgi:hypothetical protein